MFSPRLVAGSALIFFVYLGLCLTNVFIRSPWCDEAWFASPAYNLAYKGFMGTTVLDPASSTWKNVQLTGIDRHTYWVMPLNLLWNAGAFRVFGFSVFSMRLLSVVWGLLALGAWAAILWKLTGDASVVLGGLGLIAIDYHFLMQASDGRMDAMAFALGWCGVAVYLLLRERRFPLAVAASQTLTAMSFFTHPNGLMLVLILLATTLYFDRRRIRISTVALAAVPYLSMAAGWALYIARSPADFAAQFLGNISGRGPTITTPLAAIQLEIANRYIEAYGLARWSSVSGRLNAIPLLLFFAGLITCLVVRQIRRHPGYRLLLIWTAIVGFYLTELEGLKTHLYLIYLTPLYAIVLAIAALWCWRNRPRGRILLAAAMAVFVILQVARTPIADLRNPRRATYQPAVEYLRAHYQPGTFIMGGADLMFGLGPEWHILDDVRLGYNSGKRADVVVIDTHWADNILMLETWHPPIFAFVTHLLASEYREVYNHRGYRILVRLNSDSAGHPPDPLL
jgi:hypothetical protein